MRDDLHLFRRSRRSRTPSGRHLGELAGKLGGKGGGKPDFAMGGAPAGKDLAEAIGSISLA